MRFINGRIKFAGTIELARFDRAPLSNFNDLATSELRYSIEMLL